MTGQMSREQLLVRVRELEHRIDHITIGHRRFARRRLLDIRDELSRLVEDAREREKRACERDIAIGETRGLMQAVDKIDELIGRLEV